MKLESFQTQNDNLIFQKKTWRILLLLLTVPLFLLPVSAQNYNVKKRLKGFDQYMEKTLKAWNTPGAGVGIIIGDSLVFVKGYGYRDYEKKLPITKNTMFQIASNTKLFTVMAMGMLVEDKKIEWDKPVSSFVPSIEFYNEDLNRTVTMRDMLAHRTGISRHDLIWYRSDFSRKELYERLKYLEPRQPIRESFLYNNMMYISAGQIIEELTQNTWEETVQKKFLAPLNMKSTVFSIKEMKKHPDYAVLYNEKRDTTLLYKIPYYEDTEAVGPAGSIISNINDLSHWMIPLLNRGKYKGKQIIPASAIQASLKPSIAMPNNLLNNKGYAELLNSVYGMGRWTASYKGHLLAYHGGDLNGIHSQISCMPQEKIGVIVFVIGDHSYPLYNTITYNVYERLLGLAQTPWSERWLKEWSQKKKAGQKARSQSGHDRVPNTHPSHDVSDYVGYFEHPAYGKIAISQKDTSLWFDFHHMELPLHHYHYDRFDTPLHEEYGQWALNFYNNPQGEIDQVMLSLDESQVTFYRQADPTLSKPDVLNQYVGKYDYAGSLFEIVMDKERLLMAMPGQPKYHLIPHTSHVFKVQEFPDIRCEFVMEKGVTVLLKYKAPSGIYKMKKK